MKKRSEMGNSMKLKGKNIAGAVLLVFVLSLIPLIVSAYKYNINLSSYPWFSGAETSYDFFLYWKGQALVFLCALIALYVAAKMFSSGKDAFKRVDFKYLIPLLLYFFMCVLSTAFSEYRDMAVKGGHEQWEGMLVIGAYVVLLFVSYWIVQGETEVAIVLYGLLAGVLVLSFMSAMQCFGHDFFRTEAGQAVMNFMNEKKLKFTFNFPLGRVYSTLYNPNYVGSYVALVLPVVLSLVSFKKKAVCVVTSVVSLITAIFLVIMLFGSESVTGCIGVVATLVLFAVFMITNIKKYPGRFAVCAVLCVGIMAAAVVFNKPVFEYGVNKIMNPTPNHFAVKSIESKEGILCIKTSEDDLLRLNVYIEDDAYMYEAADEDGKSAEIYRDESTSRMKFKDKRFQNIEIYEDSVIADEKYYHAIVIDTPSVGKSYKIALTEQSYANGLKQTVHKIYNPFGRLDRLRNIESFGFEDNQHFGSRRGYIWSRTIPLLKKHILLGSGPNTFVCEFPNDDYVGMKNVGYDGAVVTKPHNMFMQIFVQTGLISLLAYIALFLIYFVECARLYFSTTSYTRMEKAGFGIMLGTFGYFVTGLANDSTVAVAPMYWCLLGVGMAINRYNRKREK